MSQLRYLPVFFILFAVTFLFGCGSNNPKTYKISGKVTFNGGAMPGIGNIYFVSADGTGSRGIGDFDTTGEFRVSTWKPGDGLQPGTYNVSIECMKTPRTGASAGTSFIDRQFNDGDPKISGLAQVTVSDKAIKNLVFDVSPPEVEEVEQTSPASNYPKYQP